MIASRLENKMFKQFIIYSIVHLPVTIPEATTTLPRADKNLLLYPGPSSYIFSISEGTWVAIKRAINSSMAYPFIDVLFATKRDRKHRNREYPF